MKRIILLIFIFLLFPISIYADNIILSVDAPTDISTNTQFVIAIDIEPNGYSIAGIQFSLSLDPTLINIDNVTEGEFFTQNNDDSYFLNGIINNTQGIVKYIVDVVIVPGHSSSKPGVLARISLTSKDKPGTSSFILFDIIAGDINGNSIPIDPINSTINITNNTKPSYKSPNTNPQINIDLSQYDGFTQTLISIFPLLIIILALVYGIATFDDLSFSTMIILAIIIIICIAFLTATQESVNILGG